MSDILFDGKSTKTQYGLIVAPYMIPMPTVQTSFVQIPGRDGSLDMTEGFGCVRYGDRVILLTLYATAPFDEKVTAFVNGVHGKRIEIVFDRDSDFYYIGRADVNGMEKSDGYCTLSVTITAEPYKRKQSLTTASITGNGNITLHNLKMPVVPFITATAQAKLGYLKDGTPTETLLAAGTHTVPDLMLQEGETEIAVETNGTVTFSYREGCL